MARLLFEGGKEKGMSGGVLVHGPPGTGLSLLARALAVENRAALTVVSYDDLYGGGEEDVLRRVYESSEASQGPRVLHLKGVDKVGSRV